MAKGRRGSKNKQINPTFYIFCEGKTEEAYVNYLRTKYRLPSIIIHAKIKGQDITKEFIKRYVNTRLSHKKDKTFLMYDLDVGSLLPKLQKINNATLLVSNPCIELWFLLHLKSIKSETGTSSCLNELKKRCPTYEKGNLSPKLEEILTKNQSKAVTKAKQLIKYQNPSTSLHHLIDILEELKEKP